MPDEPVYEVQVDFLPEHLKWLESRAKERGLPIREILADLIDAAMRSDAETVGLYELKARLAAIRSGRR